MVVNDSKTAVMCVSDTLSFEPRVALTGRVCPIEGKASMKFLGITLDSDCTFSSHVNNLRALSKLKRRGMSTEDLKYVYVSMIRPTVEYASPAWHSMLTKEQSNILESQQAQAMKNILGPGISYRRMKETLELDTLQERREAATLKFGLKCANSVKFGHWFPQRRLPLYERRSGVRYSVYQEKICRTDRHKNSPLNYTKRLLNNQ